MKPTPVQHSPTAAFAKPTYFKAINDPHALLGLHWVYFTVVVGVSGLVWEATSWKWAIPVSFVLYSVASYIAYLDALLPKVLWVTIFAHSHACPFIDPDEATDAK